jgi:hypothetical protein
MAAIYQIVWEWRGAPGMPGYTNLHFDATTDSAAQALAAANKSRLLWPGLAYLIPSNVTLSLRTDVRVLSDIDGELLNIYTVAGVADVAGTGNASAYAAASGGCIDWLTTTVNGTRRMQGRTFIVPMISNAFAAGPLSSVTITALATAAEAMRTASGPTFGVWGRPIKADPDAVPPIVARAGLWGPATSSRVPSKGVVLTTRRD